MLMKPRHQDSRRFRPDDPRAHPPHEINPSIRIRRRQLLHRDSFREMQLLVILTKIQQETDGITGYQLQELYAIPRGSLIRLLKWLEEKNYVAVREEIVNGRVNKFYTLTEDGAQHLEEIRVKWAERGEILDDLAPFERYGMGIPLHQPHLHHPHSHHPHSHPPHSHHPHSRPPHSHRPPHHQPHVHIHHLDENIENSPFFRKPIDQADLIEIILNKIELFQNKEEVIDFLRGHRSRLTQVEHRLDLRLQEIKKTKDEIDVLINQIEKMEIFDPKKIEDLFPKSS
ncbi:MAG: helix-turn-helix transcriptional regulator [Candidatus Lokiarchaeota archaeon]|nr:helix-turn-helix transcriptional regulator [Candidatus Harpocratesius repetitus]